MESQTEPAASTQQTTAETTQTVTPWQRLQRSFFRDWSALIGSTLVGLAILTALFSPLIAPYDPSLAHLADRLKPPFWMPGGSIQHLLGADAVGRDILTRIIYGARISLLVGVGAVVISLVTGVILGLVAGYKGGWIEDVIMRLADMQLAFPFILLAITIMAVLGSGLWKMLLLMGFAGWVQFARLVRSEVLSVKENEFVHAAQASGASTTRIIFRHILPNVVSSIIVVATLNVATNILIESGLTYLGLGVDPSIPTWGGMLSDGREYVSTAWWVSTFPGLAIMFTVLGFNLLGDWLRDTLDPQL